MKRGIILTLVFALCFGTFVYANNAQSGKMDESFGRFATKEDVVGYWDLVQWPPEMKRKSKVDPWPATPYQYFVFYDDGHLFYKMSTEESPTTPQQLDEIYKMSPQYITYEMKNGFMFIRHSNILNYGELWGVNIITKHTMLGTVEILPGDLIMSLDDGKGNVVYYRHLRRLKN